MKAGATTFFSTTLLFFFLVLHGAPSVRGEETPASTNTAPALVLRNMAGDYVFLSAFCYPEPEKPKHPKSVVVLNFMASDCVPCKEEMPVFLKVTGEFKDKGVKVFVVGTDEFSKQEDLKAVVKQLAVTCEVLLDPYKVACKKFKVEAIPRTIVLSRSREIVGVLGAGEGFEKQLKALIEKALAAK